MNVEKKKRVYKENIRGVSLDTKSTLIVKALDQIRPHGWFSQFVQESLKTRYLPDFKENVLLDEIRILQEQRDNIEAQISNVAAHLSRVKQQKK